MKNLVILLFLNIVIFFNAQDLMKIKSDYENLVKLHIDYEREVNKPNLYFFYSYLDENNNYQQVYLNKKKYDSLTLLKHPDSFIIRQSIYRIKQNEYTYVCLFNTNQKIYYYQKYFETKLVQELTLYEKDFGYTKKDNINLTLQTYYFGEGKYPFLYKYQKFSKTPFDLSTNLMYNKIFFQDGTFKIYDFKKDFPLSDQEFIKKIPNIFAEQSVDLLKDGKKVKNIDKNTAKNISLNMMAAIMNSKNEYKFELKKGYSEDDSSKPVYSVMFFTPKNELWTLAIDPKTEKITYIDYGIGVSY